MDHESDIRALVTRWIDAVDRGTDLEAVVADHTDDTVMYDVPPPYEGNRGLAAYRDSWPEFLAWQRADGQFVLDSLEVTAGEDVAFAHALVVCRSTTPDGEHPDQRLRLTLGLRRIDGQWRLAHEHHSFTDDRAWRTHDGEQAVAGILQRWHEATAKKDLDGLMADVAADVVSYEHEGPLVLPDLDAVRESCRRGLEATQGTVDFHVVDPQVVVRDDLAVVWGLDRVTIPQPEGDAEVTSRGTRVFRRRGGRWVLVHQHLSFPRDGG